MPDPQTPPNTVQLRGSTLLELRDVRREIRARGTTVEILRGVNLQAKAGEVTALLGPNGAGKTTTLNIAQGLDRPDAGTVKLLGQNPWRAGADLRSQVGVMLQDGGLPPSSTPGRLLRHVASLYAQPVHLDALSGRLGIDEFASRSIRRLSGGQKQRVALAAALIGRPRVVFLDEPSAGLDPISRKIVFNLITELKRSGLAIILTTHLLDDAQRLADQVVLLNRGQVVRSGSVTELTMGSEADNNPLEFSIVRPLTAAETHDLPDHLTLWQQESDHHTSGFTIYHINNISSPDDLVSLTQWWQRHQLMPERINMADRSLEDVFWEVSP